MKLTFLKVVEIILGTIVILFITVVAYIIFAKPFGIDVLNIPAMTTTEENTADKGASTNPLLTKEQENMLQNLGVDTSQIPSSISPEMLACFTEKLGETRVQEILGGDSITLMDYLKAKSCIQ